MNTHTHIANKAMMYARTDPMCSRDSDTVGSGSLSLSYSVTDGRE
ncbi:MAG TPA: hypothetical protein VK338_05315 [Candidatus Nitrosocosmicus sp.]|nr:hypothetical protein [Candidatus Nitrosocosmicus sp.]